MAKAKRRTRAKRARKPRPRAIEIALAGLAHDIRTPLTGILALSQLLQASELPKRERGWAEAIRGAADHLARLTTLVVDAAKADSTGLVLRDEPFSPRELAQSVAGSLTARAQGKALDVEIDIAARLPDRVSGDEVRLRSALENLVDNAVKFTERGTHRLRGVVGGRGARAGAADVHRHRQRHRHHRSRPQTAVPAVRAGERRGGAALRRRRPGTGLRQAHRQGDGRRPRGDQQARPRQHVSADGGDEGRRHRPRAGAGPAPSLSRRLRVLCVEDNPYGRIVHSAVLRELGHVVSFVGSGEAAVETVAGNEHDVVLMDIALSGIDGIEATRRIRALPAAGRAHSDHRRLGPHRAARCRGRDGGRHERLSAQARVARRVERGAADGGEDQARRIRPDHEQQNDRADGGVNDRRRPSRS